MLLFSILCVSELYVVVGSFSKHYPAPSRAEDCFRIRVEDQAVTPITGTEYTLPIGGKVGTPLTLNGCNPISRWFITLLRTMKELVAT